MSASFTLWASGSHIIYFVAAHSEWTTTPSWAVALYLIQSPLVNNHLSTELFVKDTDNIYLKNINDSTVGIFYPWARVLFYFFELLSKDEAVLFH